MTKRTLLAVLIGGFSLVAAPLMGCGDDPVDDNENQEQNDDNDNDNGDNDNDNDNNNNDNGDDGCSIDPDCEGDDEICDQDTGQCVTVECQQDEDCDGDATCEDNVCEAFEYDCEVDEDFWGQLGTDVDNAGGNPTTDAFTESAGIGDVVAYLEGELDDYSPEEIDDGRPLSFEPDEAIEIDSATVTAVEYISDAWFWIGDADAGMYVRLPEGSNVDETPTVGDHVSFSVDEVGTFGGDPQIQELSGWTIESSDNDVHYVELGDDELDRDEHFARIARVGGLLTDNQWECGSNNCFEMRYGNDGQYTATFQTPSDFDDPGECLTFVGPISVFPGIYSEGAGNTPEAQVSASGGPDFGSGWYQTQSEPDIQ